MTTYRIWINKRKIFTGDIFNNLNWILTFKGPNIAGRDPQSREIVRLFDPRQDHWGEHFEWNGPVLHAQTAIGRATIGVLRVNLPERVAVRRSLMISVLGRSLRVTAVGLLLGGLLSLVVGRLMAGYLFEVSPWDPAVVGASALVLVLTCLAAAAIPARRASRVDPLVAMRWE